MNTNRNKGHGLERQVASDLKVLFPYVQTSRAASRMADNCAIDLVHVPFLIQCKAGYNNNRPKYEVEFDKVDERIKQHFPKDHVVHSLPFLLIHKPNAPKGHGRKEKYTQVTMSYAYFNWLLSNLDKSVVEKWPVFNI